MKILLATHSLSAPGGSETYLLTVAFALEQLGHEIAIFTLEPGEMSQLASQSGLRVIASEQRLGEDYDAIIAQDGATSYALAERLPSVRQLYVAHTADFPLQYPPQLAGVVGAIVALNDRVAARLGSLAHCPPLIRLRQPIDTRRFNMHRPLPQRPARLTVFSNYLRGERLEIVELAAREMGLRLAVIGGEKSTLTPEEELRRSDVVFGCGRSALEAMACGCAVYVLGHLAADGWVTAETYPALERDGFAGLASERMVSTASLCADLAEYEPAMGPTNHSLAVRHHDAGSHAAELVAELRRQAAPSGLNGADGALWEMSRLVRAQWQMERRALALEHQLRGAEEVRIDRERELQQLRDEYQRVRGEHQRVQDEYQRFIAARRYRLAQAIARPLDLVRRRRARP